MLTKQQHYNYRKLGMKIMLKLARILGRPIRRNEYDRILGAQRLSTKERRRRVRDVAVTLGILERTMQTGSGLPLWDQIESFCMCTEDTNRIKEHFSRPGAPPSSQQKHTKIARCFRTLSETYAELAQLIDD